MRAVASLIPLLFGGVPVLAQLNASEFSTTPNLDGWDSLGTACGAITYSEDGNYVQELNFSECGPPFGGQDGWITPIDSFNGVPDWFYEIKVAATGDSSEFGGQAPFALSAFNFAGESYNATISDNQVKLLRDVVLPIFHVDVTPGNFHTLRVELHNGVENTYRWFVDRVLVDEGIAEDVFPSEDARISWHGRAWQQPTINMIDYIRYGVPAADASGDWDSDGQHDNNDLFYVQECFDRPDGDPGCTWADMDSDDDVDCDDWTQFANSWTGPGSPPLFAPCAAAVVPTVSQWGLIQMSILSDRRHDFTWS